MTDQEIIQQCERHFLGDIEMGRAPAFGMGAHTRDSMWVQWSARSTLSQLYRCVESGDLPSKARLSQLVRDEVCELHRENYGFVGIAGIIAWIRIAWLVGQVVAWMMSNLSKGHTSLGMAMRNRSRD